jgi:hypothetical protein
MAPARTGRDPASPDGGGSTRAGLLRRATLAAGASLAGVTAVGAARTVLAAPSAQRERDALNLLLAIEYAEVALYEAALGGGGLEGELEGFAKIVVEHERAHLNVLQQALKSTADKPPKHDFAAATASAERFADTAAKLEDLSVGAYNSQAGNVSREAFAAAARIVSVEARHAAWIRSIVGKPPAPDATDAPRTDAQIRRGLAALGVTL